MSAPGDSGRPGAPGDSTGSRLASLERMLGNRPHDSRLRFGLALEYLKAGRTEEGVRELRSYLDAADDEGNGWGRLGAALRELGRDHEALSAYRRAIDAADRHGHPTMADEFREIVGDWPS
jgi:E3 SUMO-protein ligase RanBP2